MEKGFFMNWTSGKRFNKVCKVLKRQFKDNIAESYEFHSGGGFLHYIVRLKKSSEYGNLIFLHNMIDWFKNFENLGSGKFPYELSYKNYESIEKYMIDEDEIFMECYQPDYKNRCKTLKSKNINYYHKSNKYFT